MPEWLSIDAGELGPVTAFTLLATLMLANVIVEHLPDWGWKSRLLRDSEVYEALRGIAGDSPTPDEADVLESLRSRAFSAAANSLKPFDRFLNFLIDFMCMITAIAIAVTIGSIPLSALFPTLSSYLILAMGVSLTILILLVCVMIISATASAIWSRSSREWEHRKAKGGHEQGHDEPREWKHDDELD